MVDCYVDEYILGLWGHENKQYPICNKSRTGFVVTIYNCTLLWVEKIQKHIFLYTIHYKYMGLYHSARYVLPLKSIIK